MVVNLASDQDLTPRDVQQLANADAVAAFFATLGYDLSARLPQTAAAMGITAESLQRKLRRIERLADQEHGALQVYLVELDSVTVAALQGLARALRNRAGEYLLVLTSDYEQLDFVLLERELPTGPATPLSTPRVTVRPRGLTVSRRNPTTVELRVLRRFTYTEADADAQHDKLRSAFTVADWSEPNFNNRALFADYFLNVRLRELPEWREDPKPALLRLRELYRGARERFAGSDEAAARSQLLEPTLDALGFTRTNGKGGFEAPDELLALGADGQAKVACLAYGWDRYLDGKDEQRDKRRADDNPGARVVSVLQSGPTPWAVVTNGKLWRLYSAAAHSRATSYYEIDLEETLAMADPGDAFRCFWLLFRAEAFRPRERSIRGERRELAFVDNLLDASTEYARQLGERLKERVFEEVFPELAAGFIAHMWHADGAAADLSQERLDQVFRSTLTLLYRVLFLLYAEARDLLPVREVRGYWERSLSRLKTEIASAAGPIKDEVPKRLEKAYSASPTSASLYDRLLDLARAVDQGDPALNTPVYNGGLFLTEVEAEDRSPEAEAARFLSRYKVPDRFLALALDRLARDVDDKRGDLVPIDYKSLGVRQLGSIYEGLLEFRLRIAPEKMAIVKGKKTDETIPYREAVRDKRTILRQGRGRDAAERTLPKGALYLENDRRERKATGSYYTPDHIVQYIVAHTVGPVLHEHLERLRPELREAQRAFREARRRQEAFQRQGMLRRTRETILAELERQGVSVDAGKLTDVNLLKRHVLKRCIYGADLNPMAVELAKVSLWLDCFTLGAPLSFLDHHLKCGNSLLGTTVQAVEAELAAQRQGHVADLFGGPFQGLLSATALMEELARMPDATVEQARRSHSLFEAFEQAQAPYKAALDIWLSRHFGNRRAREYLTLVGQDLVEETRGGQRLSPEYRQAIATAATLSETRRFFHWDLEFPEAYVDLAQKAWKPAELQGFHAVVGNPPWIRQESLAEQKQALQALHPAVYDSIADTYVYFVGRGLGLLRSSGLFGMVLPNKWLRAGYGRPLRAFLTTAHRPVELVDFGHAPLFPDADTFPCLLVACADGAAPSAPSMRYCAIPRAALDGLALDDFATGHGYEVPTVLLHQDGWTPEPPEVARLLEKLRGQHRMLGEVVPHGIFFGIKPGLTEAFFVDQPTRDRLISEAPGCEPLLRKALRGRNIERWHPDWDGEWLILLKSSENQAWPWANAGEDAERIFRATYPSLYQHLKPVQDDLQKRQDRGRYWWELRSCSYYQRFGEPKILYQDMGYHSWLAFDDQGFLCNNTCYFMPTGDPWILAVLNSSVAWWYLSRQATHAKDEAFRLHTQFMEEFPIAKPGDPQRAEMDSVVRQLVALAGERQDCRRTFYTLLTERFGVERPSRKLEQFWRLGEEELASELRRSPGRRLSATADRALASDLGAPVAEYRTLLAHSLQLELWVQRSAFELYGLSAEEVELLRRTAPPRDPLALAEEEARWLLQVDGGGKERDK